MSEVNFKEFEEIERVLARSLFEYIGVTNYSLEEVGNYAKSDGEFITPNSDIKHRFEIKVRSFGKDKYPYHFIEEGKVLELLKFHRNDYRIHFIMFFKESDGTYSCIAYNLTKRFNKWKSENVRISDVTTTMNLPTTTAGHNCYYVDKTVIPLWRDESIDVVIESLPIYDGYSSDATY